MATGPAPKRRRRNSKSDAEESRLGQCIEAFKKIHRSDNRARAGIGELVHLAARSRGKHRLRDSLCKAIDNDDVLLSQLQNAHSFDVFEDDLTRLFMAELEALQDVPLFGPFSPEVMDYVKTLIRKTPCLHLSRKRHLGYIAFSISYARTILNVPRITRTAHGL
ncbi:hypothetical protein V8E54_012182 [Elaphomyces granulatus]